MRIPKRFISKGWVIDINSPERSGLVGKYWWWGVDGYPQKPRDIPENLNGYLKTVFKTRKLARQNLGAVKRVFPKATVRRANIIIEY